MTTKEDTRQLDERRRDILKRIIRSYINSGEPVGSRTLSKFIDWRLSPATMRNIMADLEEAGFPVQPQTSAARVPSAKDCRYFLATLGAFRLRRQHARYIRTSLWV